MNIEREPLRRRKERREMKPDLEGRNTGTLKDIKTNTETWALSIMIN